MDIKETTKIQPSLVRGRTDGSSGESKRGKKRAPSATLIPLINQTFLINNDDDCLLHPTTIAVYPLYFP